MLKTNNSNSNTTSTKWSSIWKWSKSKASSSSNTSTANTTKAIINKKSTNNGDENSWGIPTLRLRDHNGDIIPINPNTAVPIDTKYFKGNAIVIAVNSHIN